MDTSVKQLGTSLTTLLSQVLKIIIKNLYILVILDNILDKGISLK